MEEKIGQTTLTRKQLQTILQRQLGRDLVVEECTSTVHAKEGECSGVLLALKVVLRRSKDSPTENLHLVAKFPQPTEFLRNVHDFKVSFCKEMNFYKFVAPELYKLQKECGIPEAELWDHLAEYCGAQTSLAGDEDALADMDAVLLLENLKIRGYKTADKFVGLDLKHCELTLHKFAHFHAMVIALRLKKPEVYQKTVMKAAAPNNLGGTLKNTKIDVDNLLRPIGENIPETIPYMGRLYKQCSDNHIYQNDYYQKEPFATIFHNDFWINNIMFLYGENSSLIDVKFIDFQTTLLCSPVRDLIYFLFVNATDEVVKNHFDHLLSHYHTSLVDMLGKLGCDTSPFSFKTFQEEIKEFAPCTLFRTLSMANAVRGDPKDIRKLSDVVDRGEGKVASTNQSKYRILTLIKEYDRRGWLTHDTL